jgi:bcr-type benzoyl-CoA reductase subunit C
MFTPFREVVSNVSETILRYEKELNRPVIGVMPAYFPLELITAAGGYPVQLWGNNLPLGKSDAYLQAYCCSVARSVIELELVGAAEMVKAYAFTSLCDTLINLREVYRRLFPKPTLELSIPMTRKAEARNHYMESAIKGLIKGLEAVTGQCISPESMAAAVGLHGRTRALQRQLYRIRRQKPGLLKNLDFYTTIKAGFFLPPGVYNDMLATLLDSVSELGKTRGERTRLIASGMVFDPLEIHQALDEAGVEIVDDDFANGWRTVSKGIIDTGNLVQGITEFLFSPTPCCCLYNPDRDRHAYLLDKVRDVQADGVLFWYTKFCEPDAFDRPQLIERLQKEDVPTAVMEVEVSMTNFDTLRTRINAFCEILAR